MNFPNALSLLRIFLVTPFLIAIIYRQFALALFIFVIAGISDFFDGYLARRWEQQTLLGFYLDPMGDKLLITAAFIALSIQNLLPSWLAVTVVAKDVYIALGTGVLFFSDNLEVVTPTLWGKLSTLLQLVAVGLALLSACYSSSTALLNGFFALTGLATAMAFFHYLWRGVQAFSVNSHGNGP